MKRLVWLTDIHLDFLSADERQSFFELVAATQADAVLVGGDVAEAPALLAALDACLAAWQRPIYFVLGNHDYYHSSVAEVRRQVRALCRDHPRLVWLTDGAIVQLAPGVGLIGHDGWADARLGDYRRSLVMMNDYKLIAELAVYNKADRWPLLKQWGDQAAHFAARILPQALARFEQVYFLTHVPPFRESCWYQGRISDDEWLPHFTCHALGEALLAVMCRHPRRRLVVLCGHTHGRGAYRPLENLLVLTGGARYGQPEIQQVIDLPREHQGIA